jgi:hypothetical protein
MTIHICRDGERDEILSIINMAADAYHGVISADCWYDPYMSGDRNSSSSLGDVRRFSWISNSIC